MSNLKLEYRSTNQRASINSAEGIIEGRPIVFNQRTAIGNYFYEEIDPHALDNADLTDIKFLINHDDSMIPVARHRRGKRSTMDIAITQDGLDIIARLDLEKNMNACMLCSAVEREDITDMSYCYALEIEDNGDEWQDIFAPMPIRRIKKIRKVYEISAVNDGAYSQTSISVRSSLPLDNEKTALDNARKQALDNENRANVDFELKKKKFKFMEESKK